MDQFRADLHIHSRHSRATSKALTPRHLAAWARVKGLDVLGTGDFTHPGWLAELQEHLAEDGRGLLTLKNPNGLETEIPWLSGYAMPGHAKFILSAEISSIYKRGGKVRKVHNLVYLPSFEAVAKLNAKLARVGNLASDGRPILGLDSRHLLEMVLETDPLAFLVPAHIWTPWFSLFGSKSGFDSIEECFGALSSEIFALETGLSSDPEMNWLISALDRFRLISNSDAHSGDKLGRECNLFSGSLSYEGIYRALRGEGLGNDFLGTVEFFPEEGKYHLDGHRDCGVVMDPHETRARGGICPVCKKPLTVGVLSRVLELSDREHPLRPQGQPGFVSLIPLCEVLGEIHDQGPATKKVKNHLARLLNRFGPEMHILAELPLEDLAKDSPLLAEAVSRMRLGRVFRQAGFDGEFGRIRVFGPEEMKKLLRGGALTTVGAAIGSTPGAGSGQSSGSSGDGSPGDNDAPPGDPPGPGPGPDSGSGHGSGNSVGPNSGYGSGHDSGSGIGSGTGRGPAHGIGATTSPEPAVDTGPTLNDRQNLAARTTHLHTLVQAGPGTGKTHTLVARIRHLLATGVDPASILVVTFTRRAAQELQDRLEGAAVRADTLHALAHEYWTDAYGEKPVILSEDAARRLFAQVNPDLSGPKLKQAWQRLMLDRERMIRKPLPVWPPAAPQPGIQTGLQADSPAAPLLAGSAPLHPGSPTPHSENANRQLQDTSAGSSPDHSGLYARQKASWNLVDYTDLLEFWLEKIETGIYSNGFKHILVDEVQDLSPLQLAIIRALASGWDTSLFAIGDPLQSIYGFRGAVTNVRRELSSFWHDLETVSLTENYRSTQQVLALARGLFPQSPELSAVRRGQGEITEFTAPSAMREVSWIAGKIRALIGSTSSTLHTEGAGLAPGDIAILVRFKGLMDPIQKALTRFGVPCSVPEAEAFWADPRVKAILNAAGRFLGMADMEGALTLACPDRVLAKGPKEIAFYLRDVPPFDHLFWQSPEFAQLCGAYAAHSGWAGLLSYVNAQSELELVGRRAEKVRIMTLHAAKGLEFEAVFLPALEDGILPFAGTGLLTGKPSTAEAAPDEREEERLFYVGLTRAKSRVYLSHAEKRDLYGRLLMLKPSRLLKKLDLVAASRSHLAPHTVRKEKQLGLL